MVFAAGKKFPYFLVSTPDLNFSSVPINAHVQMDLSEI